MDAKENELACRLDPHPAHRPSVRMGSSHKRQSDEPKYCEMVALREQPFSVVAIVTTDDDGPDDALGRLWYLHKQRV